MNTSAQGLRVLVTAGAAGIGRAFASTFFEAGAKVFVCDIDPAALSEFQTAHPEIGTSLADVSVPAHVDAMFVAAVAFLGGLDVLINNAGITGPTAIPLPASPRRGLTAALRMGAGVALSLWRRWSQ